MTLAQKKQKKTDDVADAYFDECADLQVWAAGEKGSASRAITSKRRETQCVNQEVMMGMNEPQADA